MSLTTTREYHRSNEISGFQIEDYLPYSWIIEDLVVFKDLSVGSVLEVELPAYFTTDLATREYYHQVITQYLNSLDSKFNVQFLWCIRRNCDDIINKLEQLRPDNKIMREYHKEVIEKLKERAANNLIRRYKCYIAIVHKPVLNYNELRARAKEDIDFRKANKLSLDNRYISTIKRWLGIGTPPEFAFQYTEEEWKSVKNDLLLAVGGLELALQQIGFRTEYQYEDNLMATLFEWWNPTLAHQGIKVSPLSSDLAPITDYFLQSPVSMDRKKGYLYFDNKVHRILTLRTPPTELNVNVFENIFNQNNLPNLRIINNFIPYPREKRITELQDKLPLYRGRMDKELKYAVTVTQIQTEILSLQRGEESVWNATTIFHIWGDTEAEVDKYAYELKQQARLCGRAIVVQEEHALWKYWTAAQPFWPNDKDMHRMHVYSTSQAVCLIPLSGHPERSKEPITVPLEAANSAPFNYNPLDYSRLSNYNCLIAGTAGTGKSFAGGSIIMSMQALNARVIGIDLGGSYMSLCESLNGNYVTMNPDSTNMTINPLSISGTKLQASEKILITRFLEKAVKSAGVEFEKNEASFVDEVLNQLFDERDGKLCTLSNLREALTRYGKPETTKMAESLGQWCGSGQYGGLYDGASKVDFDKPFTVFDLALVKDNPDIAPLTIMSIMSNVYRMAAKYINQPKILLMDEAWMLMKDPVTAKFVEECFRTFRKLNVAVIAISQGIDEWLTEGASRILGNVNTFYLLGQTNATAADKLADVLQLNDQERTIIKRLKTVKGQYSQALFRQTGSSSTFSTVVLNRPTPLQYAIMTTNPADKQMIEQLRVENHLTPLEARLEFSRRYPHGV